MLFWCVLLLQTLKNPAEGTAHGGSGATVEISMSWLLASRFARAIGREYQMYQGCQGQELQLALFSGLQLPEHR